jgi:hypothetical protein
MSNGATVSYHLRPNKAVDRELFLALLGRLAGGLLIEKYSYIGLGGPFLEDFRMIHARLGITDLVCIEKDEDAYLRQIFNLPFKSIVCVHSTIEDYLYKKEITNPVILWLDYTEPSRIFSQINVFCNQVCTLPIGSIVRLTLNANPDFLGTPARDEVKNDVFKISDEGKPTIEEWRLVRLRDKLGNLVPTTITSEFISKSKLGGALLQIVDLALDRKIEGYPDRRPIWCLATHYADGQAMVTCTVYIATREASDIERAIESWPFYSTIQNPHVLDLPALSTKELFALESSESPKQCLKYRLPKSGLLEDPLDSYTAFYRIYPHFARIEL